MKEWYYAQTPGTRVGLMICTACNKPIESGQFRYHTTKDAHLPQHRGCSESDPEWKVLDNEKASRVSAAKETLEDMKRIQARGFWDVRDDMEEIESILANERTLATQPAPQDSDSK